MQVLRPERFSQVEVNIFVIKMCQVARGVLNFYSTDVVTYDRRILEPILRL
jgi:hypothetical protein